MSTQLEMANELLRKSEAVRIERIKKIELLVCDMYRNMTGCNHCHDCILCDEEPCRWEPEMRALGLLGELKEVRDD